LAAHVLDDKCTAKFKLLHNFASLLHVFGEGLQRWWHGRMTSNVLFFVLFVSVAWCVTVTAAGDHFQGDNSEYKRETQISRQNFPSFTV